MSEKDHQVTITHDDGTVDPPKLVTYTEAQALEDLPFTDGSGVAHVKVVWPAPRDTQ